MISGNDDRLAFVIDTDAKLDGIKAARAEVAGLGVDTQRMGVSSIAATKNMGMWSALQAEAAGHVGEHSLAIGRLERNLASAAGHALGLNSSVELLGSSLLKFGIGSVETIGILAGIAAIAAIYEKLTGEAHKLAEANEKVVDSFEKVQRAKHSGAEGENIAAINERVAAAQKAADANQALIDSARSAGSGGAAAAANPFGSGGVGTEMAAARAAHNLEEAKKNQARLNEDLRSAIAERDAINEKGAQNTDRTYAGNLSTLVSYNAKDDVARQRSLMLIRAYQSDLARLADSEVEKRAEIIGKIKTLNAPFEAEEKKAEAEAEARFRKEISRLTQLGNAADASVLKAIEEGDKRARLLAEGEKRGDALHADLQAKALEFTLQSLGKETEARLAANDAEFMRRQMDIANLDDTEAQKTQLFLDNEQLRVAGAAAIRRAAADKEERERQTAEEKIRAAEKRKERIMLNTVDSYVRSSASLQKILIQAALSPLIKELEGTAVRQFVRAAASFAAGDFTGAARHAAAGVLATAGAREVAQLGEMSGGGGSSGGGGGSSGPSSTFEPRTGTEGQGMVTINLLSQNPYGPEAIQQVSYLLQRGEILKRPIPIGPTNQLLLAAG